MTDARSVLLARRSELLCSKCASTSSLPLRDVLAPSSPPRALLSDASAADVTMLLCCAQRRSIGSRGRVGAREERWCCSCVFDSVTGARGDQRRAMEEAVGRTVVSTCRLCCVCGRIGAGFCSLLFDRHGLRSKNNSQLLQEQRAPRAAPPHTQPFCGSSLSCLGRQGASDTSTFAQGAHSRAKENARHSISSKRKRPTGAASARELSIQ